MRTRTLLTLLLGLGLAGAVRAEDSAAKYAENLAKLRSQVEALSTDVEQRKEDLRGTLRSLDAQKGDIEGQIRREELRGAQLDRAVEEQRNAVQETDRAAEVLTPVLRAGIADQRRIVKSGMPFHIEERLDQLDQLEAQLAEGTIRPQKAASRLWQIIEDELRLTRENALDRQLLTLDGEELLCEVARIGMVAMFFQAPDGRYGRALRDGDGWVWRVEHSARHADQLATLFDALSKQIRVGFFEIPNALPGVQE